MRAAALLLLLAGCGGGLRSGGGANEGVKVTPETLRKNTVSIEVETPERIAVLFQGIADRMSQRGKGQLAEFFESQTSGSFGSGFVVQRDGDMYIVTNRHVVDFADTAQLVLEGSDKQYPVEVLYADRLYDLAVLSFPDGAPHPDLPGLRLSLRGAKDLETVVATGFPGLDGQPSYQVTRGQVSNERFTAQVRGQTIPLIQHTAPIDPGSSGGPLTGEDGAVVGVNFIKYTGRDNVYLAIPADAVKKVLDSAVETKRGRGKSDWLVTRLSESCNRLVGGLRSKDEPTLDVYDLMTNQVVADRGFESMDSIGKNDRSEDFWGSFFENPTTTMRFAVALRLWKEAHGTAGLPVSCLPLTQDPKADAVKLLVTFERGNRETFWRFEQGSWKLVGFERLSGPAAPAPTKPVKPRPKTPPKKK